MSEEKAAGKPTTYELRYLCPVTGEVSRTGLHIEEAAIAELLIGTIKVSCQACPHMHVIHGDELARTAHQAQRQAADASA